MTQVPVLKTKREQEEVIKYTDHLEAGNKLLLTVRGFYKESREFTTGKDLTTYETYA